MSKKLQLLSGDIHLPAFLPDATRSVVRAVDNQDLERCGVQGLVMSTFHLMQNPGSSTIQALGGLHSFSGWKHPIITDSGGFQIYSLIRQNKKNGTLTDKGLIFRTDKGSKVNLTPEKSIQLQMSYKPDIMYCLDDCTDVSESEIVQEEAVNRTIKWAKRCRNEYDKLVKDKRLSEQERPLIFGIIQGGRSKTLREKCANELLEIGFDGFGYGGWPLDNQGQLLRDMISYTRDIVPSQFPLHALGIGHPSSIIEASQMGYDIFDSALPTRDARTGRLYRLNIPLDELSLNSITTNWFEYIYIEDKKHIKSKSNICDLTKSYTSTQYSLGYLHHLYSIGDTLFFRLATIHNLTFISQLMKKLRISGGR